MTYSGGDFDVFLLEHTCSEDKYFAVYFNLNMSHVCKSQLIYMFFLQGWLIFCINFIYDYSVQFVCWNTWWLTYQPLLGEHAVAIQNGSLQDMNVHGKSKIVK